MDDYLSDAENRAENKDICSGYFRFLKRVVRMLRSFAITGQTDFSRSYGGRKFIVSDSHIKLVSSILDNYKLIGEPRVEMDIVMRHFFCYTENLEITDCSISDTEFFSFLSAVSETNNGSMGRTLRALKYISAFFKEHRIANLKADLSMLTLKTAPVKLIPAYSQEEIADIVSAIDLEASIGIRDNAILLLAFETGLRGIDIRNLTFADIAKEINPGLYHLHPHLFRHSRAMHLYMTGVPLPLVAEWLGHNNLETTQIYAQATIEMKRKAAEKLADNEKSVFKDDVTFKYADDDEIIKKLSGLK